MAQKIEAVVAMTNIYEYRVPAYTYGMETRYIYTMTAEDGTVYVWKTTKFLVLEIPVDKEVAHFIDARGRGMEYERINKGDVLKITATVKGQDEYKGQPQTVVQRVKVIERTFKAKTWEEIQAEKAAEKEAQKKEQMDSIGANDLVWEMPYRQYKEHYSDCETVIDSCEGRNGTYYISVIIREGRLKASGVRGRRFSDYEVEYTNQNGEKARSIFRAVCEENALKQWGKAFNGCTDAEIVMVYR